MELPDNLKAKAKADESRILNGMQHEEKTFVSFIKAHLGWLIFTLSLVVLLIWPLMYKVTRA